MHVMLRFFVGLFPPIFRESCYNFGGYASGWLKIPIIRQGEHTTQKNYAYSIFMRVQMFSSQKSNPLFLLIIFANYVNDIYGTLLKQMIVFHSLAWEFSSSLSTFVTHLHNFITCLLNSIPITKRGLMHRLETIGNFVNEFTFTASYVIIVLGRSLMIR